MGAEQGLRNGLLPSVAAMTEHERRNFSVSRLISGFEARSFTGRSGRNPPRQQAVLGPEETQPHGEGGVRVETRASGTDS